MVKKQQKTSFPRHKDSEEYKESEEESSSHHQQKRNKKKEKYIPFRALNCNYEILKIIQGINTEKGVECDILVKNTKTNRDYKVKVSSSKLKYFAPLLLCEYYEKHIID